MKATVKEWMGKAEGDFLTASRELRLLSHAAIALRYPGESAHREEAVQAFDIASRMREILRQRLGV